MSIYLACFLILALPLGSCASQPAHQTRAPHPAPSKEASRTPTSTLRVVPLAKLPRADAPQVLSPASGQVVEPIRTEVRWAKPVPNPPFKLLAMIDEGPVRALFPGDTSARLLRLTDGPLARGTHRLVLCMSLNRRVARTDQGEPACDVVWFGVNQPVSSSVSGLLAITPHGTYSGPSSVRSVPVDVFVLGETPFPVYFVTLLVLGPQGYTARHRLEPGTAYCLENLSNGDYTLTLQLNGPGKNAAQGPWINPKRVITSNADVSDEPQANAQ